MSNWITSALESLPDELKQFIKVDEKGTQITIKMQNDVVSDVGVVGCQVGELIELPLRLIQFLNKKFPCRENSLTVTKLQEAQHWDAARTRDRMARGVAGFNKE
jgi:hypothetical protein